MRARDHKKKFVLVSLIVTYDLGTCIKRLTLEELINVHLKLRKVPTYLSIIIK